MMYDEERRALIRYAGSAPEASISSKPIGSELLASIGVFPLQCQDSSPPNRGTVMLLNRLKPTQRVDNVCNNFDLRLGQVVV